MCGRYTLYTPAKRIKQQFDAQLNLDFEPNWTSGRISTKTYGFEF